MRTGISRRATDLLARHVQFALVLGDAREAEISHLGTSTPIKQNIGGFDVPVERLRSAVVHVREAAGGVQCHPQPLCPAEWLSVGRAAALQAMRDVPSSEKLVHQVLPAPPRPPAHQRHEIGVPELAEHPNLVGKARRAIVVLLVYLHDLDGDVMAVPKGASVDGAVVSGAEAPGGLEVLGRGDELGLGELQGDLPELVLRVAAAAGGGPAEPFAELLQHLAETSSA
mmetsp:Transcript_56871/g.166519  ORF Transcript_56871/g.166519 Transcript_56871/m.166519 type:complete len:227 (-) Transcript_56871:47-727(-)